MAQERPRRRLKNYLVWVFVPLSVGPLLLLSALTYVLVQSTAQTEIRGRLLPELATLQRHLDELDRTLMQKTQALARSAEFHKAVKSKDPTTIKNSLAEWNERGVFQKVRIFDAQGKLSSENKFEINKLPDNFWPSLLPEGSSRHARNFAISERKLASNSENFFSDSERTVRLTKNMSPAFRRWLIQEESWSHSEWNSESGLPQLSISVYRHIVSRKGASVGFIEGQFLLDSEKISALSEFQGVALALLGDDFSFQMGSTGNSSALWAQAGSLLRKQNLQGSLTGTSLEIRVHDQPHEFVLSPVSGNEKPIAWIALGLDKPTQLESRIRILLGVGALALLLALSAVLLTLRISGQLTRPIENLVAAVDAIRRSEWVHPVEDSSNTEIGFLVTRFNEMAKSVQVTKRVLETKLEELADAHAELTQTQGQLVQSAKLSSLGQLVAGVAHELNNPIAFMYSNMTQMKLYLKDLAAIDKKLQSFIANPGPESALNMQDTLTAADWDYIKKDIPELVQSCLEGSVRVKDIVLGLRNFSRLDKGNLDELSIGESLKNTSKILAGQIRNRAELHWDLCEGDNVQCISTQIQQVFLNLMANAIQSIEVSGDIFVKTWKESVSSREVMAISIRDTGMGINSESIDKIFDPFFTTKKVGEGTGLGLSIVYGIVERHLGTIQVRSVPSPHLNHGTEFVVRLPIRAAGASGSGSSSGSSSGPVSNAS